MLIEIMGPSGVGKTTLLKLASKENSGRWISGDKIKANIDSSSGRDDRQELKNRVDKIINFGFVERCIDIVNKSNMRPSQKFTTLQMFNSSLQNFCVSKELSKKKVVVHDELLMHRGFSILTYSENFESDVVWFYKNTPLPNSVLIMKLSAKELFERIKDREFSVNTYRHISDEKLKKLLKKNSEMYVIAKEILKKRKISVESIDTSGDIPNAANKLLNSISLMVDKMREN